MSGASRAVGESRGSSSLASGAPAPRVREMFARIAPTYDLLNHLLSARRDVGWRRAAAATLDPGARRILDLCAGTGDLALEIARQRPQAFVTAGDFCFEMLVRGKSKGLKSAATCDGLQLPFASGTFDAVTAAFGVRNFENLERGLVEMRRVVRPGGQLIVLEFFRGESAWREAPFNLYFKHVLPAVGRLVSHDAEAYAYLPRSVGRFVSRGEFVALLERTGWTAPRTRDLTLGIATLVEARAG